MSQPEKSRHPKGRAEGRDLGDEYLIYDRKGNQVHVLNVTAREIYLMCDGRQTEQDIAAHLSKKFGVDGATAEADVHRTLEQLRDLGILDWS